jgi:hypothetical protein
MEDIFSSVAGNVFAVTLGVIALDRGSFFSPVVAPETLSLPVMTPETLTVV